MVHVDPASGTVVLNAATVPRVVSLPHSNGELSSSALSASTCADCPGSCMQQRMGGCLSGGFIHAGICCALHVHHCSVCKCLLPVLFPGALQAQQQPAATTFW